MRCERCGTMCHFDPSDNVFFCENCGYKIKMPDDNKMLAEFGV